MSRRWPQITCIKSRTFGHNVSGRIDRYEDCYEIVTTFPPQQAYGQPRKYSVLVSGREWEQIETDYNRLHPDSSHQFHKLDLDSQLKHVLRVLYIRSQYIDYVSLTHEPHSQPVHL